MMIYRSRANATTATFAFLISEYYSTYKELPHSHIDKTNLNSKFGICEKLFTEPNIFNIEITQKLQGLPCYLTTGKNV